MKFVLSWQFLMLLVAGGLLWQPMALPAQGRPLRLFLIGNSFSQNATAFLPRLVKEGGHELVMGRAEAAGYTLQQQWDAVEAEEANPADPKGKIYGGKSLRDLLAPGTWDLVSIQQGSVESGDLESYRPYARELYDFIKKLQPRAEVIVHETWTYRSDAPYFSVIAPNTKAKSSREMWEKLQVAYHTVAAELGVRLVPVGEAFWSIDSDPQWGYRKDPKFDFRAPVFPHLPEQTHSLNEGYHWESPTEFKLDPRHANEAGKYLGSLVWYAFLFHESPRQVQFAPAGIPPDFAAHLREVAAGAVLAAPYDLATPPSTSARAGAPAQVKGKS